MKSILAIFAVNIPLLAVVTAESSSPTHYSLTEDEITSFLPKIEYGESKTPSTGGPKHWKNPKGIIPPGGPLVKAKVTPGIPMEECTERTGQDPRTKTRWHFTFKSARCVRLFGNRRFYRVTCKTQYRQWPVYQREFTEDDSHFSNSCPERQICQDVSENNVDTIECVDEETVGTVPVRAAEVVHGAAGEADMFCADTLTLPGPHYKPVGRQPMNMVLTEEVFWPNGTAYDAPLLLIHDQSASWKGLDRAWRRNTNIASALVTFEWVRGKLQEKKIQFCMKMKNARRNDMVIFMYSWFPMHHRGLLD